MTAKEWIYIVAEGDNLWNFSKKYLRSATLFREVQSINNIKSPRQLPPGTAIRVPLEWVKTFAAQVSVVNLQGVATKHGADGKSDVTSSTTFELGDELYVPTGASVTIQFADKSRATIMGNSSLKFDQLSHYGKTGMVDTSVLLNEGKIEVRAQKAVGAGSRLDIKTASAITSVRGTVFRTGAKTNTAGKSVASVEVIEGAVAVSSGDKKLDVPAGFGVQVTAGAIPDAPEALLAAPVFSTQVNEVSVFPHLVHWQPVVGAVQYQVLVASDADMEAVVWQSNVSEPELRLNTLAEGRYFLRVSPVAISELIGLGSTFRFDVNVTPQAPRINDVKSLYQFQDTPLTWQDLGVNGYRLEVAKSTNFAQPIISRTVNAPSFLPPTDLPFGQYYWRVATLADEGELSRGPFSAASSFSYKPLLLPPKLNTELKGGGLQVDWGKIPDGVEVEIEQAEFNTFDDPKVYTASGNRQFLELIDRPIQYVRARLVQPKYQQRSDWSGICLVKAHIGFAMCKLN